MSGEVFVLLRADLYKQQGKAGLAKRDLQKAHELDYEMDPALRKM